MILPECTIIIPTRNRPDGLKETVRLLCEGGLSDTPIIVVDDASDDPDATEVAVADLKSCRMIRQAKRTGQAGARNTGLQEATTTYVLLLDDDCHIVAAEPLIRFLQSKKETETIIWRFPTIREYDGDRMGIPVDFPRSRFAVTVGNGALLDRKAILSIGGFRDILMYRGEENDLSIRIFRAGWHITFVPDIEFIHRHLPNDQRGATFNQEYERLTVRNTVLFYGLNYPFPIGPVEAIMRAVKSIVMSPRYMYKSRASGLLDGVVTLITHWNARTPLSYTQLWSWQHLRSDVRSRIHHWQKGIGNSKSNDD